MKSLSVLALSVVSGVALADYDVAVTSVGAINHRLNAVPPEIGDPFYGVRGNFTVTGTPGNVPIKLTFTCGAETASYTVTMSDAGEYWYYAAFDSSLMGNIPITVQIDPGSGDTDPSNNAKSGSFTPHYPFQAIERYAAKPVAVRQSQRIRFKPGTGTVDWVKVFMRPPVTTDWQGPITDYVAPQNSTLVTTQPSGLPLQASEWQNFPATPANNIRADQTWKTTLRNSRLNPNLMASIPWAAIDAPLPADVAIWQDSEVWVPTDSPQITDLLNQYVPANYRETLTPWETIQKAFLGPVKHLTYDDSVFRNPLQAWDDGRGQCGDYSYLFVVALRRLGFAARINSGWWSGESRLGQVTHVWAEFYMPGVGWVPADPCLSNAIDPTGGFIYYLGAMPDLDQRTVLDTGGNVTIPDIGDNFVPYQAPAWYWNGSARNPNSDWTLDNSVVIDGTFIPYTPEVVSGQPTVATFELKKPAPSGGTVVTFASSSSDLLAPRSITIPQGQTLGRVSLGSLPTTSTTRAVLTATFNGRSRRLAITLVPYKLAVVGTQRYVAPGGHIPFSVSVGKAVTEAITVQIDTVPSSGWPMMVTIPAGAQSVTGSILPPAISGTGMVELKATWGMSSASDAVLVAGS